MTEMKRLPNDVLDIQESTVATIALNIKNIDGLIGVDLSFSSRVITKLQILQALKMAGDKIMEHECDD